MRLEVKEDYPAGAAATRIGARIGARTEARITADIVWKEALRQSSKCK